MEVAVDGGGRDGVFATAVDANDGMMAVASTAAASEVQSKMIFMGHQISSYHVPVFRSFFIFWKTLLPLQNLPYDHLQIYTNITFQYPQK
jgi:hypothetical protein